MQLIQTLLSYQIRHFSHERSLLTKYFYCTRFEIRESFNGYELIEVYAGGVDALIQCVALQEACGSFMRVEEVLVEY